MNKQQTLQSLEDARRNHQNALQKVKSLIDKKDVNSIPCVYKTGCEFGKWLYDESINLKKLLGSIFYKELDALHSQWHLEYRKIFLIFFTEPDEKGVYKAKKVEDMQIDKCRLYYTELETTSEKLFKSLLSCKRRLDALAPEKF